MISLEYLNELVREYVGTAAGRSYIASHGVQLYTPDEMKDIATRLKNDIIDGFASIQENDGVGTFNSQQVSVQTVDENKLVITFASNVLKRKSLLGRRGKYTGRGINDIFALFTHGWNAKRYVYGIWVGRSTRRIRSRLYYPGNPWITHIVGFYESEYPGLIISYPAEWGG